MALYTSLVFGSGSSQGGIPSLVQYGPTRTIACPLGATSVNSALPIPWLVCKDKLNLLSAEALRPVPAIFISQEIPFPEAGTFPPPKFVTQAP